MGLSGTIDGWPPSFLDAVAAKGHRVLVFDNEGVGRSTLRPGTLTIRRMGQDTARFIRALHLRRPDVVGWSMGGMIAQSLAIDYPKRLRRLVLMATAPGDGHATFPDAAALTALSTGDAAALLPDLFPPDQVARPRSLHRRPAHALRHRPDRAAGDHHRAARGVHAVDDGQRSRRREAPSVRARTLVGGGRQDGLLPVANQQHIAQVIPHAKLVTYPDAAHGFFFQESADFLPRLTAFLR